MNKYLIPENFRPNSPLKWVGSKKQLIDSIVEKFPPPNKITRFIEPFVGAGHIHLSLVYPPKIICGDSNKHLINFYNVIKHHPEKFLEEAEKHRPHLYEKAYYQKKRLELNKGDEIERAAVFLYINRTCFNGLWRTNSKGEFNTPYANRPSMSYYNMEDILNLHRHTRVNNIQYLHQDYRKTFELVEKGDLVYCDPPYYRETKASFTQYAKENFTEEDHIELFNHCYDLAEKGAQVVISNSDTPFVHYLYKGCDVHSISVVNNFAKIHVRNKIYEKKEVLALLTPSHVQKKLVLKK